MVQSHLSEGQGIWFQDSGLCCKKSNARTHQSGQQVDLHQSCDDIQARQGRTIVYDISLTVMLYLSV